MVLEMQYSILHCSSRYHPLNALALLLAFDQNRKSPLQQKRNNPNLNEF